MAASDLLLWISSHFCSRLMPDEFWCIYIYYKPLPYIPSRYVHSCLSSVGTRFRSSQPCVLRSQPLRNLGRLLPLSALPHRAKHTVCLLVSALTGNSPYAQIHPAHMPSMSMAMTLPAGLFGGLPGQSPPDFYKTGAADPALLIQKMNEVSLGGQQQVKRGDDADGGFGDS